MSAGDSRYERGLQTRREVLGNEYVDRALGERHGVHRSRSRSS